MSDQRLENFRKRILSEAGSVLTPLEHYLVGGSAMGGVLAYEIDEKEYKDNPLKPKVLIEAGEVVNEDVIRIVNEERERIGKYSGFPTALMFGLPFMDQAFFRLEPIDSTGLRPLEVRLAEVIKPDGLVIADGLEQYRLTPDAIKAVKDEFPVLREARREGDVSKK